MAFTAKVGTRIRVRRRRSIWFIRGRGGRWGVGGMNRRIAEDFIELDRDRVRAALDAAFVRGYQRGVEHGEQRERLLRDQQDEQLRDRKQLDGLVPESPLAPNANE